MNKDLRAVASFASTRGPADVRAAAERLLDARTGSPGARKGNRKRRKVKVARHSESTNAIRQAVFTRASIAGFPLCELCSDGLRMLARVLAHLESGNGRRRQQQSEKNTAASCSACNDLWDEAPSMRLEMATVWSQRTGHPVPEGVRQAAALKGWRAESREAEGRQET
jgi:hypothetical protein